MESSEEAGAAQGGHRGEMRGRSVGRTPNYTVLILQMSNGVNSVYVPHSQHED